MVYFSALSSTCSDLDDIPSPVTFKKPPSLEHFHNIPKLTGIIPASRIEVHSPEMVSSGIRELDFLAGGLPRGGLTEVYGPASSGRTSMLLAALAASTKRDEICALVDVNDAFDPISAQEAEVNFEKLLWVRCGRSPQKKFSAPSNRRRECPVEQALRVTDLLLQSGGFGLVIIDLGDVAVKLIRRIPLTSWFRFRRAVENTPTVLFVIASVACAPACASLLLNVKGSGKKPSAISSQPSVPTHSLLWDGQRIEIEVIRSRMGRKPMQSVTGFATRAVRAG
jgi:hypothetical protein